MTAGPDDELHLAAAAARAYWSGKVTSHLCDRAVPGEQEWLAMFGQLVADIASFSAAIERIGEPTGTVGLDPREPLVWAWCVLDSMPNDQEQRYQKLREKDADGSGIVDRAPRLRHRGYVMEGDGTDRDVQVAWLAALARVLDDDLAALEYWPEDVTAWQPDDWLVPGYSCSMVPVKREHRLSEGRPAQRRALLYHAVIPTRIGSLEVKLWLHPDANPDPSRKDPTDWSFGAAVFPVLTVEPHQTSRDGFRLARAETGTSDVALLGQQLSEAGQSGCDVLVWPELAMPDPRLRVLKQLLAASPLDRRRIPLVVGGSWHVESTPGIYVNRSEVMLGDGETLMTYDKRRRFPWKGLTEDIEVGGSLPIIVMEDRLIGIAICRDYCDDIARSSYGELPVDLVIVPSMGESSTVDAHERHAVAQRSRQGTVTFVVQQNPTPAGGPLPASPPGFSFVLSG